jgi:hypothetical protein
VKNVKVLDGSATSGVHADLKFPPLPNYVKKNAVK